jgi:hypothetical protein
MPRLLRAAGLAAISSLACNGSHSVAVINRSDAVIEQVYVTVGLERGGLGGIGPGVHRVFIFSGALGKEAVLEWETADQQHRAGDDLRDVPRSFAGTILLEVMKDATVKKSLEDPIPGL